MRQVGLHMVGIVGCVEGRLMARIAGCGSALELIVYVAGGAVERGMHAGKGKACHLEVIELSSKPVVHGVAILTGGGKT